MVLVSPNSGFLLVAYSVAVLSVLGAFGMLIVDGTGVSSITGAYSANGIPCVLGGDLGCAGVDFVGNDIALTVANVRNEPVIIEHIRLGNCNAVPIHARTEIKGATSFQVTPCFSRYDLGRTIPVEIYTSGVFSGTTRISSGKLTNSKA